MSGSNWAHTDQISEAEHLRFAQRRDTFASDRGAPPHVRGGMSTWPIIDAKRRSAYVSYADRLQEGDVVQCTCCDEEFPQFTSEDLKTMNDGGYECVTCCAYICENCWERGYDDVPGTYRTDPITQERAYISFAFAYMQW